jgi:hypothetical protein
VPCSSRADNRSANAAVAQQLFDEALKLMDAARYADACPKLARSQELAPSGGTLLNLGDCYEKNGQTASAWVSFRDAAARAAAAGQKQAQAAALVRADKLATKLVHLKITLAPGARTSGLEIKRDGEPVSYAELGIEVPIDPGVHKIEASAPNHAPWSKDITVLDGSQGEAIVVPVLEARAEPPAAAAAAKPAVKEDVGSTQRTVGIVVAATGFIVAGIGGIFGLKATSTNDDALMHCRSAPDATRCDPTGLSLTDDARTQATISTVMVTVGTAALAGGLVIFAIAPRAQQTAMKVRATPFAGCARDCGGGMSLHTTW